MDESSAEPKPETSPLEKGKAKNKATERRPDPKTSTDADPFLLDKIYPEAHRVFETTAELLPKSNTVMIALDTNALLLPYSMGQGDLSALATVYSQFANEERLFLPERVAREFIKNRDRKLAEMAQAIDDRMSKMGGGNAQVTPLLLDGFPERDALATSAEGFETTRKTYLKLLGRLSRHVRSWRGNDPVTTLYADLFTSTRMIGPGETPEKIIEELEYGLRNRVPPGYKDGSKDDRGIGDVVIWMSLLNLGKTIKKDLIFVTGEQKADWFVRSGSGPVYPRPELIDAYRRASGGRSLRLSSLHDVLKEMSAPDALVANIEVAEATANSAIQSASFTTRASANLARTAKSSQMWEHLYSDLGGQLDGYVGDNEPPTSQEEADLVRRLDDVHEQLRDVRAAIKRVTQDDVNTSLALPWNKAAHELRNQENQLSGQMSEILRRLSDLQRLERKGGY